MYKKMYLMLFIKVTDALEAKSLEECKEILMQAQYDVEEYCLNSTEEK